MTEYLAVFGLVGWVLAAAYQDTRTRRIPNLLTGSGTLAALALRFAGGWDALGAGLMGLGVAFGIAILLFSLGALGGGDGKLLMMVGAFLGVERLPPALLATALAGGVLALFEILRRGAVRSTLLNLHAMALRLEPVSQTRAVRSLSVPYGIAIATGAIVALLV